MRFVERTRLMIALLRAVAYATIAGSVAAVSSATAANPAVVAEVPPATQPATLSEDELPTAFRFLQTRSPFAHGHAHAATAPGDGAANAANATDAGFVLKGVAQAGDSFTAFVEDTTAKKVELLTTGATVARGTISAIDLDSVEYTSPQGPAKHIRLGQSFDGQEPSPPPTPPPSSPAPAANASGPEPGGAPHPRHGPPGAPDPAPAIANAPPQ